MWGIPECTILPTFPISHHAVEPFIKFLRRVANTRRDSMLLLPQFSLQIASVVAGFKLAWRDKYMLRYMTSLLGSPSEPGCYHSSAPGVNEN